MPLATRIGMRLLYHGVDRGRFVRSKRIEEVRRTLRGDMDIQDCRLPLPSQALRFCSEREGTSRSDQRECSQTETNKRSTGRKYDDPNNALRKIKAFIRAYRSMSDQSYRVKLVSGRSD